MVAAWVDAGVSHHARGAHPASELSALGCRCAMLGSNRSWTTFAVLDADIAVVLAEV